MNFNVYEGDKPYIFISYAHADADTVLPVIEGLGNNGFRVWFDQGIEAATEWPEYIAEHIEAADSVIVFMSNAAAASHNCRREVNFAIESGKQPLVVYLEEVKLTAGMRMQLNTLQAMFKYRASSNEEFLNQLCKARILQPCHEGISYQTVPSYESRTRVYEPSRAETRDTILWAIVKENRKPTKEESRAILDLGRRLLKNGNSSDGIKLIRFTSQHGYDYGSLLLGYCYDKGIGVTKDYYVAIAYYGRAGSSGNADASYKKYRWNDATHLSRARSVAEKIYNEKI